MDARCDAETLATWHGTTFRFLLLFFVLISLGLDSARLGRLGNVEGGGSWRLIVYMFASNARSTRNLRWKRSDTRVLV